MYPPGLKLNKANTEILKIPRLPFLIYISLFLTALFPPKFMISVMTSNLIYFIFSF